MTCPKQATASGCASKKSLWFLSLSGGIISSDENEQTYNPRASESASFSVATTPLFGRWINVKPSSSESRFKISNPSVPSQNGQPIRHTARDYSSARLQKLLESFFGPFRFSPIQTTDKNKRGDKRQKVFECIRHHRAIKFIELNKSNGGTR